MAGAAGIFDFLHCRPQVAGFVRLNLARGHQFTGGRFKVAGQLLELRLLLPDIILGTGVIFFAHARKMLPRLMGQRVQLDRAFGKFGASNGIRPRSMPPRFSPVLSICLKIALRWPSGEFGSTPPQADSVRQASNTTVSLLKVMVASRSQETAASILASPAKTNSPINNKGCPAALRRGQPLQEVFV